MSKRILTTEEKQEILSKSNKFTAKQLSEEYKCSRSTILKIWMDNNYHKPLSFSYYINDTYFSIIDTPYKAYIVGLIASDGNVYKRDGHDGQIRLCLKNEDGEYDLLSKILIDMDSTHPILQQTKIKNNKGTDYVSISITSQQLFDDLYTIGIIPQKTWLLNIKQVINHIPPQFIRDFLRGYFDGDGSIIISTQNSNKPSGVNISIAIPLNNAELLKDYFSSINIVTTITEDKRKKYKHPFANLRFFGANKYIFLKWIYYENCLCLKRKYELALHYCKLIEDNVTNRSENIRAVNQYKKFINNTE